MMKYVLDIVEGELLGRKFLVRDGLRIGRREGEVILNDRKVSAIHAQIEEGGRGELVLVDLNSSNGIFLNGRRLKKIPLAPGMIFQIGKTHFKVLYLDEDELEALGIEIRSWQEILRESLLGVEAPSISVHVDCRPFVKPVRLTFSDGPLTDEFYTLGFGPRKFGFCNLDMDVKDPQFPEMAFELVPGEGVVTIKNHAPGVVLLNKENFSAATLNDGDTIQVEKAVLKVSFL